MILAAFAVDWYAARAAGVVAYLLLTSSIVLGLVLAGRARLERWPRFALEDVHRFAGLLAGWFIGIHVLLLLVDAQAKLSLAAVILPFTSSYRPLWTGLGVVAAELLVAIAVSNHYRKRLPHGLWRRLHYLNFAVWVAATGHGLGAGSDRGSGWLLSLYLISATTVAGVAIKRFGGQGVSAPSQRSQRESPGLESAKP